MSAGGYFVFGGASSRDYGILIDSVSGIWDTPERDSEQIEIPGRNGDLTVDNGRWKNVPGTYTCGIGVDFEKNFERFRAMITAHRGYARLEDSWHPDEFRMAKLVGSIALELIKNGAAATFDVNFTVMPQRYLNSGEKARTFTSSGKITNPTAQEAKPLLRVYGTGTFSIGSTSMQITAANTYTDIDCDICECYRDTMADNRNASVKLLSGGFPVLHEGDNGITLGSGISRIIITPRWWKI